MKNCFEFCVIKLTQFIMTFGIFEVIDVLQKFSIISNVITLDQHYLRTDDVTKMMFGASITECGYFNLKARSDLVKHLVQLITNPGSPEEALKINSALKTLCRKVNNNAVKFYGMVSEGMHGRLIFQKLSQVYAPLIEEIKTNKEFLIMLINNQLIEMDHLQELTNGSDQDMKISHYIIHNVNSYRKLKKFLCIVQNWVRDTNMVEQIEEIIFDLEMFQCAKINDKITTASQKILCELY